MGRGLHATVSRQSSVASYLSASGATVTDVRVLLGAHGGAGSLSTLDRWQSFLPLELRSLRSEPRDERRCDGLVRQVKHTCGCRHGTVRFSAQIEQLLTSRQISTDNVRQGSLTRGSFSRQSSVGGEALTAALAYTRAGFRSAPACCSGKAQGGAGLETSTRTAFLTCCLR